MLSTDRKVFDENSQVRQRLFSYGNLVDRLDIIVFNTENEPFRKSKLSSNVYLHPTNSRNKLFYFFDAIKIVKIRFELKKKEDIDSTNSQKRKIDLVTAQDSSEVGLIAWVIAKKLKAKLELQVHTDLLYIFGSQYPRLQAIVLISVIYSRYVVI